MSIQEKIQAKYELLGPFLKGRLRRLWAATEAMEIGPGGVKLVAAATGMSPRVIRQGRAELRRPAESPNGTASAADKPSRRPGRPPVAEKDPGLVAALERLLKDETAGDPMGEKKWMRTTLRRLSERLTGEGHPVSYSTVRRMLRKMKYSLKCNRRKERERERSPDRDEQFRFIASRKETYTAAGLPIISVDTKKKELIGNFKNNGQVWCKDPTEVSNHGFASEAECVATPYGVYDLNRNRGFVVVGLSHNTPEFAVTVIARWWEAEGRVNYPNADEILLLADGGGGNGSRHRAWKLKLQELICDRFGVKVTVCHYPTGCSKYNPVEYKLFSQISINWAGKPLRSLELMLGYIRGTTTSTGLTVQAFLDEGVYRKGRKVSREDMKRLNVNHHDVCPQWNYTISPRKLEPAAESCPADQVVKGRRATEADPPSSPVAQQQAVGSAALACDCSPSRLLSTG
jgi:transposase